MINREDLKEYVSGEVFYQDGVGWFSQKMIAELFGIRVGTVNEHIKKLYGENGVAKSGGDDEIANSGLKKDFSTIRKFLIVQKEGKRDVQREVQFYSHDVVIAISNRVNSNKN